MSTTLEIPASRFPEKKFDGPIMLTYSGADPTDPGPAGTLLKMLIAQTSGDPEAMKKVVTAQTMEFAQSQPPAQKMLVNIGEVKYEDDDHSRALVPAKISGDGQEQELPFIVVQEDGAWKVDMIATIDRVLPDSMQQINDVMQQAMEGMAHAMGEAMNGVAEGLSQAFGPGQIEAPTDESEPGMHPRLADFRQWLIDLTGVRWDVSAEWQSSSVDGVEILGLPDAELASLFDALKQSIERGVREHGSLIAELQRVRELYLRRDPRGDKSLEIIPETRRLEYTIGEDSADNPQFYTQDELATELYPMLRAYADWCDENRLDEED
jgi:hypothetical protein